MNWTEAKFKTLYAVPSRNGLNRPSRVRGSGYRMVNMGELLANARIGDVPMESVPMSDRELGEYLLEEGDLLFARQSLVLAGAGKCSYVLPQPESTTFESHLIRVRLDRNQASPLFYHYYFASPYSGMSTIVQQCAQAGIRGSSLGELMVAVPALSAQQKIAEVLSSYDDLIENNRRRMKLLENAARLLYEEWFVRLRFPGHERVRIKDGVPKGWESKPIGEVAVLNYGKALKDDHRQKGTVPVYGSSGVIGYHDKALVGGPGIVVGRKGNAGSVFWSDSPFWPIDTVYFVSSELSTYYLYHCLQQVPFQSTDVAVPGLNRTYAHSLKILAPSTTIRNEFEDVVGPMYGQITKLRTMNGKLRAARDLLLPRLMSGEVEVPTMTVSRTATTTLGRARPGAGGTAL